jgi:hypothetical protein
MFSQFVVHVMPSLPVDNPQGGVFPYTPPSPAGFATIHGLTNRFIDSLGDATAYADDLLIELQNLLLGDLFKAKLRPRTPIDPAKRAVTLDKAEALEAWFRETTEWGAQAAQVEAATRARFAGADAGN